jgi:hypothetical protein
MNTVARELLSIAKSLVAERMLFKDVPVGGLFHTGFGKGMGLERDVTRVTFYEKVDKSSAKAVKADWSPRQIGRIDRFSATSSIFPVDRLPTHDTRAGL